MDVVDDRVTMIVVQHLGVEPQKVINSARFSDDLGADSLDKIEIMMAFEDEFGCEISDEIAETILTVGDARNYLAKNSKIDSPTLR